MSFWIVWIAALAVGVLVLWLLFRSGRKKPTPIAPQGPLLYYDDDEYDRSHDRGIDLEYRRKWLEERRRRQLEDVPDVTVPDSSGFAGFGGGDSGGAGVSSDWSDSGSCDSSSSDSGSCDTGN